VNACGRGKESIDHGDVANHTKPSPFLRHGAVYGKNTVTVITSQPREPSLQRSRLPRIASLDGFDASPNLSHDEDAQP
jgi:hypothetical protein